MVHDLLGTIRVNYLAGSIAYNSSIALDIMPKI